MNLDDVPVLPTDSLFGHLPEVRRDPLALIRRVAGTPGDVLRLRLPSTAVLLVLSPAYAHEVLVAKAKSFQKSPVLKTALEPLAGQGLFTSDGPLWKRQRKLMAPLFQAQELERYAACMRDCTEHAAGSLRHGETVDLARTCNHITMAIAGRALFDSDMFGDADAIGDAITTALTWMNQESSSVFLLLQTTLRTSLVGIDREMPASVRRARDQVVTALEKPVLLPGERSRKLRAAIDLLDRRVAKMIEDRRGAGLAREDLLSALLQARDEDDGTRMSDKQVRDEILTLFIAGHETTATGLGWSFYLLGRDEAARRRVRAEVDALEGRRVTYADLPRLAYTLQVFKEALRLYPPVYVFGRQAIADVTIGEMEVPRGTVVLLAPYVVHRRPEVWPDPERFDPDRFTPEAEAGRPRCAYLPFSAGPRTCIGNHFALMEGPIVLATLLQRADFEPVGSQPIEPEASATLRAKGGIPMRVHLRG